MESEQNSSLPEEKGQRKPRTRSKSRRIDAEELKSGKSDESRCRTETRPSGYEELSERWHQAFINRGHRDEEEESAIGELLKRVWSARGRAERRLAEWRQYEGKLERNKQAIHEEIDQRRDEMVRSVEEYAQSLHLRAEALLNVQLENARVQISDTAYELREYDCVFGDSLAGEELTPSKVEGRLEELHRRAGEVTATPDWPPLVLSTTSPVKPPLSSLFGCLDGGTTGSGWLSGLPGSSAERSAVVEAVGEAVGRREAKLNEGATDNSPSADHPEDDDDDDDDRHIGDTVLLRRPTIRKQFSAKTKKERRDIGITDAAVTSAGDVIVIDKHNKLAKMFDAEGRFRRFVGRKLVGAPSRVTILSGSGEILITDNASRSVKVFDPDGVAYSGLFADDLGHPISHCEAADGRILVVDFSTRNVVVYDRSGRPSHRFHSGLRCPAYVAGTRNGSIAVSDWRDSKVRIFDAVGNLVAEMDAASGHGVATPYGVYGDVHGHLIVSEGSDNGIRIFTEHGVPVANLGLKDYGLRLPMAVCQHDAESLVSVDYQGSVKVIKYADVGRQVVDLT